MAQLFMRMAGKWEINVVHSDALPTLGFVVNGGGMGRYFYHASEAGRRVVVDAPSWTLSLVKNSMISPQDRNLTGRVKLLFAYRGARFSEAMRYDPERGLTLRLSLNVPLTNLLIYYPRIILDCVCLDEKVNPAPSPDEKFDFTLKQ